MFFFCFSFLVWLKRDGTQRTSSFHCSSHVSSVSGGGESNGSRIYDKSSAETCRVVRRRICTETGKVEKKKTDIYIFLYLLSSPPFFWLLQKKKGRRTCRFSFSNNARHFVALFPYFFFVCTTRKSIKKNGKRLIICICASLPRNTRYATQPVFFFVIAFPRFCCLFFFSLP